MSRRWLGALAALFLAGCSMGPTTLLPAIPLASPPVAHEARVALSFLNDPAWSGFGTEIRPVALSDGRTAEEAVVLALIEGPKGELLPVCPKNVSLNEVYIAGDIAFIDIQPTGDMPAQQLEVFRKACLQSLSSLCQVNYVYLSVDGYLPRGLSMPVESLSSETEGGLDLLLFYTGRDTLLMLPEIGNIIPQNQSERAMAQAVVERWLQGSRSESIGAWQPGLRWEGLQRLADGSYQLQLGDDFGSEGRNYDYGALALTLCQGMPQWQQVSILFNGQPAPGGQAGLFSQAEQRALRGSEVELYFADEQAERLRPVKRILSLMEMNDRFQPVKQILMGPAEREGADIYPVLPEDAGWHDLLGAYVENDLAVLDLSAGFYQACAGMDQRAERLLAYALVNAMTWRGDIKRVLFLCEGENAVWLAGKIALSKPLLRNPGLIQDE